MFNEFFFYEIRYNLQRPVTWVYFAMMLLFGGMLTAFAGGAFADINISLGGGNSGGIVHVNAPTTITIATILTCSLFGLSVTSSLFGTSVHRDFEHNAHALFYTAPITKMGYLAGRFAGVMVVTLVVLFGCIVGQILPTLIPNWLKPERIGQFNAMYYLHPFVVFIVPNVLFMGSVAFGLNSLTRKANAANYASTLLVMGYLLSSNLISDMENRTFASLIDPFGLVTYGLAVRYWTAVERNSLLVELWSIVGANRLLWMGLGTAFAAWVMMRFKFQHVVPEKSKQSSLPADEITDQPITLVLPAAERNFSAGSLWQMFQTFVRVYVRGIVKEKSFLGTMLSLVIFLAIILRNVGSFYGTETYPVTYNVLEALLGSLQLYLLFVVTYYAGDLVFHEREQKVDAITDTLPVPTWMLFAAKLTALVLVMLLLSAALIPIGVMTQALNGYTNFEIGLYLQEIFGLQLIGFVLLSVFALTLHTIANNKYVGYVLIGVYYVLVSFGSQIGIEHNLWKYNSDPGVTYSDMNKYGHFLAPFFWFKLYWSAFALLLAVGTHLLWVRGAEHDWRTRLALAKERFTSRVGAVFAGAAAVFAGTGGWIFYNTNVLNVYQTSKEQELTQVRYEKQYKRYERLVQPKITAVRVEADMFPSERRLAIRGLYVLQNKTQQPITELHFNVENSKVCNTTWDFSRPSAQKLADKDLGYYIHTLNQPLQPGDTLTMNFSVTVRSRGFQETETRAQNLKVVQNGTFVSRGDYFPFLGYNAAAEISNKDDRKKYGLPPRSSGLPPTNDAFYRARNLFTPDADWVTFEAIVSTDADQTAIAPGYLQRTWEQNGRKYFHYAMDSKMANFFALLSGRYERRQDTWFDSTQQRSVAIEVFYHKGHEYNIERMIKAVKASLAYYSRNFAPYQHKQLRIIEFPRYASFAQSFPNTVPYSESIGFIARVKDPDEDIDYPFYVTAHEVAHQWWGHQVIGGYVEGSQVMSETLAQYSALMVMEREYGKEQMRRFLKYELDRYLQGRTFAEYERPLAAIGMGDQYIHYNKGSLVMYALKDYLGEERVNAALKAYIEKVRFQEAPFTTCGELVEHLRAAAPDSLKYLIGDFFETITLYENKAVKATAKPQGNGAYTVEFTVEAKKVRADSVGNETPLALNDWIDVGVLGKVNNAKGKERDTVLAVERRKLVAGQQIFTMLVRGEPKKAGIDVLSKLIDRKPSDNLKEVEMMKQ